jgi:hypothetical protein
VIWIYKCNSRDLPYQRAYGDWDDFFMSGRPMQWGSTEWVPALQKARRGDTVLAYQTDRNELVGVARVVRQENRGRYRELILKPLKRIGVRVRPLKDRSPAIARIAALQPGPIQTLYLISSRDARRLLSAARVRIQIKRRTAAHEARSGVPTGAGFGDPDRNRRVEQAAMRFCAKHFRDRGWRVLDVHSKNRGYDLLCRRKGTARHVEVKGAAGQRCQFPITKRERDLWSKSPTFVLALVTRALTRSPDVQIFSRQEFDLFRFVPLAFMACG